MSTYYILLLCLFAISFTLGCVIGWFRGRKKFNNETAVLIIQNLKDSMEIMKVTCDEQKAHLSKKNTDLKIENMRLIEEINKLKTGNK